MTARWLLPLVAVAAVAISCGAEQTPTQHGRELIGHFGCGACHRIGGVDGANGTVGPDLRHLRGDRYIAGTLPNTREQVQRWIQDPQAFQPHTIMPDLGVTPSQAADIAAYLYDQ
jgi:cytochrome c